MKININFISLVAIANFNPAIITADFLNKVCGLELGDPTEQSPQRIPVHKYLKFQNVDFDVNVDRFQLKQTAPDNIYKTQVLKIFKSIYEKLPFTPLKLAGTNINCELIADDADSLLLMVNKLRNPNTIRETLGIDSFEVNEKYMQIGGDREWLSSTYNIGDLKGLARHINAEFKKVSCVLNYNYEAGKLADDQTKLYLLLDSYQSFCDEFKSFIKFLGEA